MLADLLFYATTFIFLFISIFWLLVFMSKKDEIARWPEPKAFPSLSIILPTFNEEKTIAKCIRSLLSQNYPGLRVIAVNDGSTDGTEKIVKSMQKSRKEIVYIKTGHAGKAAALNMGLKTVSTKLVGFIDSDTYLSENALRRMVGYLEGDAAGVIATIKPHNADNFIEGIQKIEYMVTAFTRKLMCFMHSLYFTPAFAIYKTDVLKKLGGFDENNITEDLEIGLRLKDNGYMIESSLNDYAYTDLPETFRDFFRQRLRWYRGYIYNSLKYSHMFFNRKFSHLGMFVLPMQYVLLALTSVLMVYGAVNFSIDAANYLTDMVLTNFDLKYMASEINFHISPNLIFWAMLLASFIIMMRLSEKNTRESISKTEYVIYIIFYPFINVFLWLCAFVYEITGAKRKW